VERSGGDIPSGGRPGDAERLETELREVLDRHESILDAAGDGIYGIDAAGRTTFVNRAATELLGWRPQDIIGKVLHDIHHHSHEDGRPYPLGECPINAAVRDGEARRVDDEVFWTTDGEAIPVEYTSTPIVRDGVITGAVVVFRDIRRRLEAERQRARAYAELASVKQRLELILNAAGEGIYGIDRDGNGTFANGTAIEMLGWRAEDVEGNGIHEMHHHSHADGSPYPRSECPVYAALRDGEVHRVDDEVFWSKDGTPHEVEYTSTPILSADGTPDGAVVVFRDISERKRLERQRDEAFTRIRELNRQLELERDYLREEVDLTVNFGEIVGESPALKRTLTQVQAVAVTPVNVLILGESGVGKEMVARAIHAASDRHDGPLIKVNCASVPKELFESEFFGHVKGAFTGAHRDRVGRMQLAHGGTLFLDEVGEIPLSLQGKLLRALQENEFERIGDEHTTAVDVRIVAATNRDLQAEVAAGRFREDLYYRLSVFPVSVPPLRERKDDILPLAAHFMNRFCDELGREPLAISRRQAGLLKSQRWPGNIRELKNVMERAVILSRGNRLRLDLSAAGADNSAAPAGLAERNTEYLTESEFRELEKSNLVAALKHADWRVSGAGGAADLLGIKPSTFSYRMKSFGISSKPPPEA
jgi:PAS domain S-box-containing protein